MSTLPPRAAKPTGDLRAGAAGPLVADLHRLLQDVGALGPEADPEVLEQRFGKETRDAVRSLQRQAGIKPTGHADGLTMAILLGEVPPSSESVPPADLAGSLGPLSRAVLQIADREWQKGIHEVPLGTNRGPAVDRYLLGHRPGHLSYVRWKKDPRVIGDFEPGWQGAPWCALFASWCVSEAAASLGLPSPVEGWGSLASTSSWRARAAAAGRLRDTPAPGTVGLLLSAEEHRGHTVIIASVDGAAVYTREGNCLNVLGARQRPLGDFGDEGGFVFLD